MDGFILTSDHVIPSFQDTEGPRAKSWTSLLKEETPEVSEVLRGTIERRAQQRPTVSRGPPCHGPSGPSLCFLSMPAFCPSPSSGDPGWSALPMSMSGSQNSPRPADSQSLVRFLFFSQDNTKTVKIEITTTVINEIEVPKDWDDERIRDDIRENLDEYIDSGMEINWEVEING